LWQFTIEKIGRSPWLGYGYGCPRFVLKDSDAFATWHAHNLILNVALATGIIGAVLVGLTLGGMILSAVIQPNVVADVILVMVLATSLTDVSLFDPIPGAFSTLWLIALFWRPMAALRSEPTANHAGDLQEGAWA
jgi:O-antigen ligase